MYGLKSEFKRPFTNPKKVKETKVKRKKGTIKKKKKFDSQ